MLHEQQQNAYDKIIDWLLYGDEPEMLLAGYAGTGKTYLVGEIVDNLINRRFIVGVSAPTNKATDIIKEKLLMEKPNRNGLIIKTIHKFLNMYMSDGYLRMGQLPNLSILNLLVIDEASMVDDTIQNRVKASAGEQSVKVLYVGDSAQLPPVCKYGSPGISPVMKLSHSITLTEVIRQSADNPLLNFLTGLRQGTVERTSHKGSIEFLEDRSVFIINAISAFINNRNVRVIAWRVKTIQWYNRLIREALGRTEDFTPGDQVIALEPYYHRDGHKKQRVLYSSQEATVLSRREGTFQGFNCIYVSIEISEFLGDTRKDEVPVCRDTRYEEELKFKWERAQRYNDDKDRRRSIWRDYYIFAEMFAKLEYSYAITAHRSQGSTYDEVYVDETDMMSNHQKVEGGRKESNHCMYVACSRPRKRAVILSNS